MIFEIITTPIKKSHNKNMPQKNRKPVLIEKSGDL